MSEITDYPALAGDVQRKSAMLHRGIGLPGVVFMVVAAVAPLGAVSVVVPAVFALSGSAASAIYFIAAAGLLCLFAVGFTLMSRYVQNAGAFYTYVQAGLGKMAGAGAASLALASYLALMVALYTYLGVAAAAAAETYLGVTIAWWALSLGAVAVVALLGYRDIDLSAKVLGVVLVLEIIVILTVDLAIIFHGGAEGLSARAFNIREAMNGAPGLGLLFAFFAFVGFESTAVFRSEVADPNRTIPRATYTAVILMVLLYTLTAWAQSVGVGADRIVGVAAADPANVMVNLAKQYVGETMKDTIQLLLVTSIFACALSFHNVVTRYQFTLANGGLLPASLGEVHPKHLAPSRSSLVVTVATVVVLGALKAAALDPIAQIYTWLSGSATLGIVLLMTLTSLSVIVFHQRGKGKDPLWNATIAPILSLIGLCLVLYLMIDNFEMLIGGRTAANVVLVTLVGCFAAGVVWAAVVKARRPTDYERMLS